MAIISPAAQNAGVAAIAALVDAGAGANGVLELRTGTHPGDITDPATGTLLVSFNLDDPAFSAPVDGTVEAEDLPFAGVGLADGDIGHYRITDTDDNTVIHSNSVGVGVGECQVSKLAVVVSESIEVTALTITLPSGA